MIPSEPKNTTHHAKRFVISGLVAALLIGGLTTAFGLVPTRHILATLPVVEVESQPETRGFIRTILQDLAKHASAIAYKQALSSFLNRVAYDTAVWIASGNRGQKPLTISNWGDYLQQTGDGAIGDYLNSVSKDVFGVNLCTFSPDVQIQLQVLARRALEPKKAECPLSGRGGIKENINKVRKLSVDDLIDFQKKLDPAANELGAFVTLVSDAGEAKIKAEEIAEIKNRNTDFVGPVQPITGDSKTPPEQVAKAAEKPLDFSIDQYLTYTGDAVADAVGVFSNTLISRYLKLIFEKGITPSGKDFASGRTTGIAAARQHSLELAKPSFQVTGPVNILDDLSSCPSDESIRKIENCVIDDKFRAAVERQLTVKQALDQGYLVGSRTFGFDVTGQEPEYFNGFPYRSLVILRKYRIIPSTWEAAALYIKNYASPARNYGLGELVAMYDQKTITDVTGNEIFNPFYHLIDPDWVLKAPEAFCWKEGAGAQLISDEYVRTEDNFPANAPDGVIDERDRPVRLVSRSNYCGDVRTCIDQAEDGTCRFYGYCQEEQQIWKFNGQECDPSENTCQTFRDSKGKKVSYTQSTVNYDSCTAENGGCRWYCQVPDTNLQSFVCTPETYVASGNKINFDGEVSTCPAGQVGCSEYLPIVAGTNLAANSSFETFDGTIDDDVADGFTASYPHWSWQNSGLVTEAVGSGFSGSAALQASGAGSLTYSLNLGSPVYQREISASIYGQGNCSVNLSLLGDWVGDPISGDTLLTEQGWQRVLVSGKTGERPADPSSPNRISVVITPNCPAGVKLDAFQLELGLLATPYVDYASDGQIYLKDSGVNYVANSDFSVDNGTDFYPQWPGGIGDNDLPGDERANGWREAAMIEGGLNDTYAAAGGYQDVPVTNGEEYDVSGWVFNPGAAPLVTECLNNDHDPVAGACNGTALAGDPRVVYSGESSGWQWVDFGVRIDNEEAKFLRIQLNAGEKFDHITFVSSQQSLACRADEVSCELYDPVEQGDAVPGVARPEDRCLPEFSGCKAYKEMPVENGASLALADRAGRDPINLTAATGETCSATYVGCEQYTNLDEVEQGGEGIEYYQYIRQCLKPGPDCATYYRWEGDEVNGFELVADSLKGSSSGAPETTDGSGDCSAEYGLNPDCLTMYDQSGQIYYRLYSKTISCSDDCHPLRNTLDGTVYSAIPEQSTECPAAQATCREYRGSTGYNIRRILEDNFESGDTTDWGPTVQPSTESITPGGLSAKVVGQMSHSIFDTIEGNQTYLVEFWAKSAGDAASLQASLTGSRHVPLAFAGTAELNNRQWNRYVLGPLTFDAFVSEDEAFNLVATDAGDVFYVDNLVVWETRDSVFLKYNSFETCPDDQVGCAEYTDRAGDSHFLKSFTGLCRESKVGCVAALATQNSNSAFQTETNGVVTPADLVRPVVNDRKFSCQAENQGCTELGQPVLDQAGKITEYKTVYLRNDPDEYASTLCTDEELFCEAYTVEGQQNSLANFKDPGAQTCEYRTGVNVNGKSYDGWFKTDSDDFCPTEKYVCVGGTNPGALCFGDDDVCTGNGTCEEYFGDAQPTKVCAGPPVNAEVCYGGARDGGACSTLVDPTHPTLGCGDGICSARNEVCYGGYKAGQACDITADSEDPDLGCAQEVGVDDGYCGERVCRGDDDCGGDQTCSEYWVGQCTDRASGCSEFRDPQDPAPDDLPNQIEVCEGDNCIEYPGCRAECRLELDENGNPYMLDENCQPFASGDDTDGHLPGCQPYFYVKQTLDSASCVGRVDESEGCVLFNDTTQSQLSYDSDISYLQAEKNNFNPVFCDSTTGDCSADSNSIIKVERDRTCNQWLYCKTSFTTKDDKGKDQRQCFSIGNCQQIGSNGECTKPVGEGQCDNDPLRACKIDNNCQNGGKCLTPSNDFAHPDSPPPDDYVLRSVIPGDHPLDITYPNIASNDPDTSNDGVQVNKIANLSGMTRAGVTWGCSEDNSPCYRDGYCSAGSQNAYGLCRNDGECPGGTCQDDQCGVPGDENICQVVHGYYPVASMRQTEGFDIYNGDFETTIRNPWEQTRNLPALNVSAVADPRDPTGENYALEVVATPNEGARLNLTSLVQAGKYYIVRFKLYSPAGTIVRVEFCTADDPANPPPGTCTLLGTAVGSDTWREIIVPPNLPAKLDSVNGNTWLKIVREPGSIAPTSTFYIDDVSIQAALEKKSTHLPVELPEDPQFSLRSCRLYPQSDSPSCKYVDIDKKDAGLTNTIETGWNGYCLEYDPTNPEYCLQWWPVDVIKGETVFDEDPFVLGEAPQYYCMQVGLYELRRPYIRSTGDCRASDTYRCDANYHKCKCDVNDNFNPDHCQMWCVPDEYQCADFCTSHKNKHWDPTFNNPDMKMGFWAPYDGSLAKTGSYGQFAPNSDKAEVLGKRCDVVGQVVDPNGENRAWSTRVLNAGYRVWDIGFQKSTDSPNFGRLVPPEYQSVDRNNLINPETWDTDFNGAWWSGNYDNEGLDGGSLMGVFGPDPIELKNQPVYQIITSDTTEDITKLARAGSPYSCKHHLGLCQSATGLPYHPGEQFSSATVPPGYGLERLQRLFAYVYGAWVWTDGRCVDVVTNACVSQTGDPAYPLLGTVCDPALGDADCNVGAGVCAGKVCIGGDNNYQPCGCPTGSLCELSQTCSGSGAACGLSACPGDGNACVASRCEGGEDAGGSCTVGNNCPLGTTCTQTGGSQKCVDNANPSCDCAGVGTCTTVTTCADDGRVCGGDSDCNKWCGGTIFGSQVCISDADCAAYPSPRDRCLVVPDMCQDTAQRCSGDLTRSCQLANNCSTGYTCDTNATCTYDGVSSCDCRGAGAFCTDGVCSNDDNQLCASGGALTGQCGAGNTCLGGADICRNNNAQCNCADGTACVEAEKCSGTNQLCDTDACGQDSVCTDKLCAGGTRNGLPCSTDDEHPDTGCPTDFDQDPDWEGSCVEAVCAIDPATGECGVNCGQNCAEDSACLGAENGVCETYTGVCTAGTNQGDQCNLDSECDSGNAGKCSNKVCMGGLFTGADCTNEDDAYCNGDVPDVDPDNPRYALDLNGLFTRQYNEEFNEDNEPNGSYLFPIMQQCRTINGSGGTNDIRPLQTVIDPKDFCWAQPFVNNIQLNGRTGDISIPNGGGTALLTFNSSIDQEQLPLRRVNIDWGDGSVDTVQFSPGVLPKGDENDPHVVTHEYAAPDCLTGCTVRVWVEDNWTRGSGQCRGDASHNGQECSIDSDCGSTGQCVGVCRGGPTPFASCLSDSQCGGDPAFCSSMFSGLVYVQP